MTYQLIRTLLLTLTALSLAACGGGGGGGGDTGGGTPPGGGGTPPPTVTPIASAGFASESTNVDADGPDFTMQSANILYVSQRADQIVPGDGIRIEFDDDMNRVLIVRNNLESFYNRFSGTDRYSNGRTVLRPELTASNQNARLVFIGDDANFAEGHPNFIVYGFDTNPNNLPATGSATFSGDIRAAYAPNPLRAGGTATGTFDLTADFGSNQVNGNMTINALDAGSSDQGSTAWTMNNATITGNGFSGTLTNNASEDAVDPDTSVNAANYDGRFYGTDADAVGGHFLIELTDDGEDTYIYGAFLGDED